MTSPWPFAQWALDLISPMPQGTGQLKFAPTIRLLTVSASLLSIQHQHLLCISGTSAIQWAGRSHQQDHQENIEEEVGSRQGQLARHTTRSTMGH
ncbi:unnamed protein product [Prunus brigantina]